MRFTDTGVGIPLVMLHRIFEPFTQVNRSRDGALGGIGLGLAIVQRLAQMHHGSVEAHSEGPGRGSEFVVRLPALERVTESASLPAAEAIAAESGATIDSTTSRCQVLVVDDAIDSAETLAHLISLRGHDVCVEHDGESALDAAFRIKPDVVFLDLELPSMDGLEVGRRLRRRFGHEAMLLVAMTGFGQSEDRSRTTAVGFDHHLVKPIDMSKIDALLAAGAPAAG